ncbi:GspE/PulE family protein [Jeotgalibacillus soli]|uniref:Bacterial type II secretion system protein E domain-containing protein n=1 Tax=Jeotgalibacillus soli TaxID=889306 RepID=A0A0C2VKS1_9BACL|nr:ATPase, T2SS/T4P/T4SS family [Jeotgalibacillus soli]KIL44568.1 hypothetical protein KP78_35320 [Jeotgalibacillus soli]
MSMLKRKRIGDLLVESGLINDQQLRYALEEKSTDEKLGDFLIKEEFLTEQQLIKVLEIQLGIPYVHLNQFTIDLELVQLVPKELAKRHQIMPYRREKNRLFVAMADPMDFFAIEELRMATGCQIEPSITTKEELYRTITKYFDLNDSVEAAMSNFNVNDLAKDTDITDEDSPMVHLVNQIIAAGVAQRASDIHLDPHETEVKVRYRVDGILRTERTLPKHMQSVVTARIKIMGNLNITENRVPQDGRINSVINFNQVDIRVSTLPTIYGEKVVMRLLDLNSTLNDISQLGFTKSNLEKFKKMIKQPNGMVLITGPTGSGKSSTLYAALTELNSDDVNIITVEDPVEYQVKGINQIQVNEDVGLTFASGLRSILRQDPDIVMIGEIRDLETAQISIRASLTGHLVVSTLHTNSAMESIARLNDMGVEPFLVSSSVIGVVAQRLVRRICTSCTEQHPPTDREKELFLARGLTVEFIQRGKGCPVCDNTGYRGRMAIHEVLLVDEQIKQFILQRASVSETRAYLRKNDMKMLLDDGLQKVKEGLTTTEEVFRVATLD